MSGQYALSVVSNNALTRHMRRVVLQGEALADFPGGQESGYVKLVLPAAAGENKPRMRSYTIRAFDARQRQLVLDFVDHGDGGPASAWARRAQPGDAVQIRGPGEKKLVDPLADWYLLAADLSALPALSVNLQQLRRDARGYAVIEVPHAEDIQALQAPAGIDMRWVVHNDPATPNQQLVEAVLALPWLPGRVYPWFAGEFEAMRRLRSYFRDERGVDRKAMYVSSYWKLGETDEGMKRAKFLDARADAAEASASGVSR